MILGSVVLVGKEQKGSMIRIGSIYIQLITFMNDIHMIILFSAYHSKQAKVDGMSSCGRNTATLLDIIGLFILYLFVT